MYEYNPLTVPSIELIQEQQADAEECECGGEFDEDDKCDSCSNGHDDCEAQECFACFERAVDRAERMAEGDER